MIRTVGTYPTDEGSESYVVDLAQGLYLLMYVSGSERDMDASTRATYAFEMPPAEMPAITPGAQMSLPVIAIDLAEGPAPFADTHVVTVGAPYDHSIGGCTYPALDVRYEYRGDPDSKEGFVYFPGLGISYFAWWEGSDGTRDTYTPLRIGVAE